MTQLPTEEQAIDVAKTMSINDKKIYYIILSKGYYYIEDNDFTRIWETLICKIENGQRKAIK